MKEGGGLVEGGGEGGREGGGGGSGECCRRYHLFPCVFWYVYGWMAWYMIGELISEEESE